MNTKQKNMIIGCIYKHAKQGTHDFHENYIYTTPNGQVVKRKERLPDHG